MADTLYLSLWYPNLRLAAMGDKLAAVLGAFARHGGEARVYSATVWPVNWSESPVFQKIFGHGERGLEPRQAVEDALELLPETYAKTGIPGVVYRHLDTPDALSQLLLAHRTDTAGPLLARFFATAAASR